MSNIEGKEIEITCGNCNNRFAVKLIQVAREEVVSCPACQKTMKLKDKDENVRISLDAIKKMGDTVKNININVKPSSKNL